MTLDIKELVKRLREAHARVSLWPENRGMDGFMDLLALRNEVPNAIDALEAMAGEVAEALPWKLFYKDGLDLEQIGKRLGKSPYDFSPWLYAPLISQLKAREKTALADLAAERDRLKAALEAFVKHFGPLEDNAMLHENVRNCYRLARKALGGDA